MVILVVVLSAAPQIEKIYLGLVRFSQKLFPAIGSGKSLAWAAREGFAAARSVRPSVLPFFIHRVTAASPTCTITAPAAGATVSATVSATASASGAAPISVQFLLDGANLGSADSAAPYETAWNTTTSSAGTHTLACTTTNKYGETTTGASVSVTVNNDTTPPVASSLLPSGILPSGTTQTELSLNTNENATCAYATQANVTYGSAGSTPFYTTGGTSHRSTVTNLANGGSYAYYVRCRDGAGNANTSDYQISFSIANASSDATAPSVPQAVSATAVSTSSITVTWGASSDNVGIAGYAIYRDGSAVGTTAGTTFTDTGLLANTTYAYTVAAYDAAGNYSSRSTAASATTLSDTVAPSVPQNITASSNSQTAISLSWSASTDDAGVAGYRITRNGAQVGTTGATGYADSGLSAGTAYTYQIAAYDAAGNVSAFSPAITASTQSGTQESNDSDKKEEKLENRVIKTAPKSVARGGIITQTGKRFRKNSSVALYFQRTNGTYYPPTVVKTTSKGTFSTSYRVTKPAGKYYWYAVELSSGKKSKKSSYTVKGVQVQTSKATKSTVANKKKYSSSSKTTHSS